jgi:hypothetical protein
MAIKNVTDELDLSALVENIKNEQRYKPVCVITTPFNSNIPLFDIDQIEKEVGDLASIFILATSDFTRDLVKHLGLGSSVFNGAAKVFTSQWFQMNNLLPLYYSHSETKSADTEQLINAIWKLAAPSDLEKYRRRPTIATSAQFSTVIGSRAFVKLAEGGLATVRQEITCPDVPLEWIFAKDQKVSGQYDDIEKLFIPDLIERDLEEVFNQYGLGNLVPVLVKVADRKTGLVSIYPSIDIEVELQEISGNDRDLVQDFLNPGEVVAMRLYKDPRGRLRLRMNDIDDDEEAIESLAATMGGPSWLVEGRHLPDEEFEEERAPAKEKLIEQLPIPDLPELGLPQSGPKPGPTVHSPHTPPASVPVKGKDQAAWQFQTKGLQTDVTRLETELDALRQENTLLHRERNSLISQKQRQARESTSARRTRAKADPNKSNTRSRRDRWSTDEDWFNEELRRVWISKYQPGERSSTVPLNLERYSFGPEFFESVLDRNVTEDELRKIVRVIIHIVTGKETTDPQNNVHPLRQSESAASSPRMREDGAKALRANIEENTAQAKRLHYWKLTNGNLELMKVVIHDDFTI